MLLKRNRLPEKKLYKTIEVSDELFNLTRFIIEAINCEARMRPEFEEADGSLVRNMEYFPDRPVIRKTGIVSTRFKKLHTDSETKG